MIRVHVSDIEVGPFQIHLDFTQTGLHGFEALSSIQPGINDQVPIEAFYHIGVDPSQGLPGNGILIRYRLGKSSSTIQAGLHAVRISWNCPFMLYSPLYSRGPEKLKGLVSFPPPPERRKPLVQEAPVFEKSWTVKRFKVF